MIFEDMNSIELIIGLISELIQKCDTIEEFDESFNNAIGGKNDKEEQLIHNRSFSKKPI